MDNSTASASDSVEIISVHVPKTAGATFGHMVLPQIYSLEKIFYDYEFLPVEVLQDKFTSKTKVIHGHFPAIKYQKAYPNAKIIVWLRNPINRLISWYYFWLTFPTNEPTSGKFHKYVVNNQIGFEEFIDLQDAQNDISRCYFQGINLENFQFIGIQEFFREDLWELQQLLNWPEVKVTPSNRNTYPDYEDLVKSILSDRRLIGKIVSLNSADMELYQNALNLRAKRKGLSNSLQQYQVYLQESQQRSQFLHKITDSDWFNLICESQHSEVYFNGIKLPKFPPAELQTQTTGASGERTLQEAFKFYQCCISECNTIGKPLSAESILLDFGVGWGRIARFFLREVYTYNLFGLDISEHFISICKSSFKNSNFFKCNAYPPTELKANQFTHIVGYSVFSHLSEKACRLWMEEFHRVLQDDGVLILTTRASSFLNYCESLKQLNPTDHHSKVLSILFDDFSEARAAYNRGEFLHANIHEVTGSVTLNSEFYGETFIPEAYARQAYSDLFKLVSFSLSSTFPIAIMVFQKIS
jgi:ubiquinone/menaquinone biosynthesis C-methylase UbiE